MLIRFVLERKVFLNANQSLHYHAKGNIVRKLRAMSSKLSEVNHKKFDKCNILIKVYTPTRRRFDPPNSYPTVKALIDGLTDAGFWDDDNYKYIPMMSFAYGGLSGIKSTFLMDFYIYEDGDSNIPPDTPDFILEGDEIKEVIN